MGNNNCCCSRERAINPEVNEEEAMVISELNPHQNNIQVPEKVDCQDIKLYGQIRNKFQEFRLRFNQKFKLTNFSMNRRIFTGDSEQSSHYFTSVPSTQRGDVNRYINERILDEIIDEDLNNSADEEVRKKRRRLLSGNLSSLTPGIQGFNEIVDYEVIGQNQYYINGKMLLLIGDQRQTFTTSTSLNQDQFKKINNQRIFIHSKIYDMFINTHLDALYDRIGNNQVIMVQVMDWCKDLDDYWQQQEQIMHSYEKENRLTTQVLSLLKNSNRYAHIEKISKHYETDNSYVFKISQTGYENIKIKMPKNSNKVGSYQSSIVEDLVYETHLQKFIYDPLFIQDIKEEIILINALDQSIHGYLVIQEEPDTSIMDLYRPAETLISKGKIQEQGIWFNQQYALDSAEHFSLSKYLFYLHKALQTLYYLHKQGIVLCGISPSEIMIDKETQSVKFRNFLYSIVLTKQNQPTLTKLLSLSPDNKQTAGGSSRLNTSRCADIDGEEGFQFDQFKLKRIEESFFIEEITKQFYGSYRKEIVKFNKDYSVGLFLQSTNFNEQQLRHNDIYSIRKAFQIDNIKKLLKYPYNIADKRLITFLEEEILKDLTLPHKSHQILKVIISRMQRFIDQNLSMVEFLIDQNINEGNNKAAIDLCSSIIEPRQGKKDLPKDIIQYQKTLIVLYMKRSKLLRLSQTQQKQAVKDIKQALFILNMHFQSEIVLRCEIMLDLIDVMLDSGEISDSVIKLQSVESLINEHKIDENINAMNKFADVKRKIYELKGDQEKQAKIAQDQLAFCQKVLGVESGDYRILRTLLRMVKSNVQKSNQETLKNQLQQYQAEAYSLYGDDSIQTIQMFFLRGQIEFDRGNYDEALNHFLNYLNLQKNQYPEQSIQRALLFNTLGAVFQDKKFYQKSQLFHQRALTIKMSLFGDRHLQTAVSFNYLGVLFQVQAQYEKALEYFFKDLNIQKQVLGENHLSLHVTYNQIGQVYRSMKINEKAQIYLEKSLQLLLQNKQNSNQALICQNFHDLGIVSKQKHEYYKAINYFKDSLKIKKRLVSQNDLQLAFVFQNLANLYLNVKKYEKALEFTQSEMNVLSHHYGPQDTSVATCLQRIGAIYYAIDNPEKALMNLKEARQILRNINPSNRTTNEKDLIGKIDNLIQECSGKSGTPFARVRDSTLSKDGSQLLSPYKMQVFSDGEDDKNYGNDKKDQL